MKKQFAVVVFSLIASWAFGGIETITYTLPADYSTAKIVPSGYDGYVAIDCAGLEAIPEPAGAPELLTTVVRIDAPKNAKLLKVTYEAEWVTLGEDIKLVPIQPLVVCDEPQEIPFAEPNPDLYASYPESPIAAFGIQRMAGKAFVPVRVIPFRYTNGKLEAAKKFVVKVEFELPPPLMSNMSLNPAHEVTAGEEYVKTDPNQPDYILIAPKNYFNLWKWYVDERQKDHPEKVMLAKNFADILNDFPVNTDDDTKGYYARNDAERLHAYIRQEAKKGTHYFVLAGSWYDAHGCPEWGSVTTIKKELTVTTPEAQYRTNADWGIPGVYTIPRNDMGSWFEAAFKPVPTDVFYACCDLPKGAKYPWDYGSFDNADAKGDDIYCNEPDDRIDLMPDVVVSRIGFICGLDWRDDRYNWTMEKLVKAYLAKVRRVEAKDFPGRNRFAGGSFKFTQERSISDGETIRDEMEFYAGQNNYFDKNATSTWMDCDYVVSLLLKDWYTRYFPAVKTEHISSYLTPPGETSFDSAVKHLHEQDWEVSMAASHGSQGGSASMVYINEYAQKMKGISKVFLAYYPCLMSYPDWTPNQNKSGTHKISHNMSMIENPDGGAAFACGNTRSSWGGGLIRRDASHGDGLGMKLGGYFVKAYVRDHLNPGDAWLKMIQSYSTGNIGWSTGRWILIEDMAMGDPMLETHGPENYTWTGATSGTDVWNLSAANWSHIDEHSGETIAGKYDHAGKATIITEGDLSLTVSDTLGAIKLVVDQPEGATFKLTGEGAVRVATNMIVSNGNVTFGVGGGVGHEGIEFVNGKGNIRFEGDEKFYLAKIKNGGTVTFAGSNGLLDLRNFYYSFIQNDDNTITTDRVNEKTIDITGIAFDGSGTGNTIRSDDPGVLTAYLPTTIENHHVRFETYNGFEGAKAAEKTLEIVNGGLTISTNPNYGLAENKCFEAIDIPLTLNNSTFNVERVTTFTFGRNADSEQEITVQGTSAITSTSNGHIGLYGTTTVNLTEGSELTISAPMDDRGNGKLIFIGSGSLVVDSALSLIGDVEIGDGITVTFKSLPLPNVTKLTIGDGAHIVLPRSSTGSYQITPIMGSRLEVGENVTFYNGSLENPIQNCIANTNGSLFDPSSVLSWLGGGENKWSGKTWFSGNTQTTFIDNSGALFADTTGGGVPVQSREVNVDGMYVGKFMQFSNTQPYTLTGTTDNALLAFGTMTVGGDATFKDLELSVSGGIDLMSGKLEASNLNTEEVRVYEGATLGTEKTGFTFDKIRFIRIYFLNHLNNEPDKTKEHRVRMEEIYFNYKDENGGDHTIRDYDISSASVSGCWVNTSSLTLSGLGVLFDGVDAHKSACNSEKQYSAELVANAETGLEDMAAGKVYLQVNLKYPLPMLTSFGVHSSQRTFANKEMTHAYRPTRFRIDASYDGVTYYTIMPDFGNTEIGGDMPAYYGGWVGFSSTAFPCTYQGSHPSVIDVSNGGSLMAMGAQNATIKLNEGAILKAVDGKAMDATNVEEWNFPEAPIKVDTSALTLSTTPQPIIENAAWTLADIRKFETLDPYASLRLSDDGTLSVVSGDNMSGPYMRTLNGNCNWDDFDWAEGYGWMYNTDNIDEDGNEVFTPFTKKWSENKLDASEDVLLFAEKATELTLDCDVICYTFGANTASNGCNNITIKSDGVHTITAATLDFSGFTCDFVYEPNCGSAHVIAGQSLRLTGTGTGILEVGEGNTVTLTQPWQGTIVGNGKVILDPGEGNEWTDLGILNCNTTSTITLNSGFMKIIEGTEVTVNRIVCADGAKFINSPTNESWVFEGKNVEIQSGGELVFEINDSNWGTHIDFTKVSGNGSIVYENKTGSALTTLGKKIPGTMTVVMRDGVYNLVSPSDLEVAVNAARIVVSEGAQFSADSVGNTDGQYKYLRMKFYNPPDKTLNIVEIGVKRNNQFQNLKDSTVTCNNGGSNLDLLKDDTNPFWQMVEMFQSYATLPGNAVVTIALTSPLPMFSAYSIGAAYSSYCPTSWDMEVSEDDVNYVLVSSISNTAAGQWGWMGGGNSGAFRASKPADLTIAKGGALSAKGNLETIVKFEDGAIIKPDANQTMTLVGNSDLILPEEGTVTIDVRNLTVGSNAVIDLIKGKEFTEADLAKFTVLADGTGYRLVLGDDGSLKLTRTHFAPKIIVK